MFAVFSYLEFLARAEKEEGVALFVYESEKEPHVIALKNLELALEYAENICVFTMEKKYAGILSGIYEMDVFPSILLFKQGRYLKSVIGCYQPSFYLSILTDVVHLVSMEEEVHEKKHQNLSTPAA